MQEATCLDVIERVEELLLEVPCLVFDHLHATAHAVGHALHVGGDIGHWPTDQGCQEEGVEHPPPVLTQELGDQDTDDAPACHRETHPNQQQEGHRTGDVHGEEELYAIEVPEDPQEGTPGQ